jgi:membrane protease YdiL (CAAX protease family)
MVGNPSVRDSPDERAGIGNGAERGSLVSRVVARHPVTAYAVLACVVSWSVWVPMAFRGATSRSGVGWPSHLPGLLGPAIAAVVVTAVVDGRPGLFDLGRRLVRWRVSWWLWAAVAGTAGLAVLGPLALSVTGQPLPPLGAFGRYTGIGDVGLIWVVLVAFVVNGFGEETGWRGFAADRLLRRHGPTVTALQVAAIWAVWHLPLFWVVESFRGFGVGFVIGWLVGLTAGSVVLTFLYQQSRHSVLLVAAWDTAFNLASATEATAGVVAAISSTVVMAAAAAITVAWRLSRS